MPDLRATPPRLLLLEPQNLMRRTVAAVAKDLRLVDIAEASSVEAAERLLDQTPFDAMVVALDEAGLATALLERVRAGVFRTNPAVPVVVLADLCDPSRVLAMKAMNVRRILLKPFKVKGVLETITDLCAA